MQPDSRNLAAKEYLALWEEYGLDSLPTVARIQKSLKVSRKPSARPTATLESIRQMLGDCKRCALCGQRKEIVFGVGNPTASLLFVGESPGTDENETGVPFVGQAGQLLDKIIEAMGFRREQVYLTNLVKCWPPNSRPPQTDEINECSQFLKAQIDVVNPKVIVALGQAATQALLGTNASINQLRGRVQTYSNKKIPVMPTYPPAHLLRAPASKREVWEDMKQVKSLLETLA